MSTSHGFTDWNHPGAGITGGYTGTNEAVRVAIVFLTGLAMYNACELVTFIFLTFNYSKGLYFWSLLVASLGIIPYALGFLIKYMNITTGNVRWLAIALNTVGWYAMVTGQALVLWSRLHLVLYGENREKILRFTKWMIAFHAVVLHIPTTILSFGSNGNNNISFIRG